jgi:hypothetical protein
METRTSREQTGVPLDAGQCWQMKDCHLQIGRVGKTLTEYKLLRKPGQRGVQSQMGTTKKVAAYLRMHKARLVERPQPPRPAA